MSSAPTLRLHLFFATQNDRAVILRQGPSKLFRMILWHRDTDRFEDGQWLKHKVYPDRCALSPDGQLSCSLRWTASGALRPKAVIQRFQSPPISQPLSCTPKATHGVEAAYFWTTNAMQWMVARPKTSWTIPPC